MAGIKQTVSSFVSSFFIIPEESDSVYSRFLIFPANPAIGDSRHWGRSFCVDNNQSFMIEKSW